MGPRADPPAPDGHHVPRRPSVAPGDPVPHPRPAPGGRRLCPAPAGPLLDRDVGRGDVRHVHEVPQGRPVGPPGAAPRDDPERPLPDAPAGLERRRLHELSRQCGARLRPRGRDGRHRPLPRVRLAELGAQHEHRARGRARGRSPLRGVDLLHRRHPQPRQAQVRLKILRRHGQGAGEARCQPDRDQGHGGPVQAVRGEEAGRGGSDRRSASRSTSTRTTSAGRRPRACSRRHRWAWRSPTARWRRCRD